MKNCNTCGVTLEDPRENYEEIHRISCDVIFKHEIYGHFKAGPLYIRSLLEEAVEAALSKR